VIQTIADALADQGYETLTPVQDAVCTPELAEADLLVSAQTGSGKTVAFGLAIAPTLLGDADRFAPAGAPLALVIAPTRELAMQVSRELTWLYGKAGAIVTTCVGGMDQRTERRALDRGAHVVVATPGRLCDHIKRNNIDLSDLRAVVLDEADEMLDLGFREELEFILDEAPENRRTLMFSATVPAAIAKLAESYQRDAQRVNVQSETRQHADIEYRALAVHPRDTENAILNVLRFYEAKNAIVFCNTRAAVARLTTRLTNRNFSVVALSGELTQSERTNALQALRDGRARVCVATDVAARGIDLPNLELVIHADLPTNADTLLHRSGRTGRAGRKGVSALIVPPKMRSKAGRLLGWANLQAEWADPPSAAEVNAADEARLLSDAAWTQETPEDAVDFVATLAEKFTPEQLATAFVNLYRARASAPEDLSDANSKDDRPRSSFGPSVWFSVSTGRNDGAEPRTLLPMICRVGDLTRDDIGAIRVQPRSSFIEVAEGAAAKLGTGIEAEEGMTLTRLDAAPDFGPKGPRAERPDRTERPQRAERTERAERPERAPRPQGKPDAPRAKKGERPPKSHKTERSPMKPHAAPRPKSEEVAAKPAWKDKPRDAAPTGHKAKPVWKDKPRDDAPASAKAKPAWKDKPRDGAAPSKGKAKPAWKKTEGGKPQDRKTDAAPGHKPYKRAADTSKRFTPPNKIGKQGGKPNARPKPGNKD